MATTPKRYIIESVASLLRVMHSDPRYALLFRNRLEQLITQKLRRKFFKTHPEVVLDAFNNALTKFLHSKTFQDDALLFGQPEDGWAAIELAESKLGGYLYRGSLNELITALRRSKHEAGFSQIQDDADGEDHKGDPYQDVQDTDPLNDPANAYEHTSMVQRMRDCLAKLSATLRNTMVMYLDDFSMDEIARQQQLQVPTVKSRLHAARKLVIECAQRGMA